MDVRPHKNASIDNLIRQMLHSQHKASTGQSDGDTVKEWRAELEYRIQHLIEIADEAMRVVYEDQDSSHLIDLISAIRK